MQEPKMPPYSAVDWSSMHLLAANLLNEATWPNEQANEVDKQAECGLH